MSEQSDGVDFALAAFRDDGEWLLQEIASPAYYSVDSLSHALRRLPGDAGAVGMVAVDEDFFVLVRVSGASTRALLSDVTAADEWELAQSVIDFLGLPPPEDDDVEVPAGDLGLLDDLGLHAIDLGALLEQHGGAGIDAVFGERLVGDGGQGAVGATGLASALEDEGVAALPPEAGDLHQRVGARDGVAQAALSLCLYIY